METPRWFEQFQQDMSVFLAKTPAADLEKNLRGFMTAAFGKLDLITREEFDLQTELLASYRLRLEALEARVQALESQKATAVPASDSERA